MALKKHEKTNITIQYKKKLGIENLRMSHKPNMKNG